MSATDFLADLAQQARTPVRVEYSRPSCLRRENIPRGRVVAYNARALEDGRIAMR